MSDSFGTIDSVYAHGASLKVWGMTGIQAETFYWVKKQLLHTIDVLNFGYLSFENKNNMNIFIWQKIFQYLQKSVQTARFIS